MIKVASFFLIGMIVLAMFGRLRLPGGKGRGTPAGRFGPAKCPSCGRYQIGAGPCACGAVRKKG